MSKHNLIGKKWRRFEDAVLPRNASKVQRTEMRRAFYAGAKGILDAMAAEMSDGTSETQAEIDIVQDVATELDEFYALMLLGEA